MKIRSIVMRLSTVVVIKMEITFAHWLYSVYYLQSSLDFCVNKASQNIAKIEINYIEPLFKTGKLAQDYYSRNGWKMAKYKLPNYMGFKNQGFQNRGTSV